MELREYWIKQAKNVWIFLRWCLFAVVIGLVVGAVGAAFHHALEWAGEMRLTHGWLLYLLPLAGLFIAFWYKKADMPLERGTNFILTSVRENHPVRLRLAPSIFLTSVLTHLCGGSAGREGAALQLGGAISGNIGHWMRLDDKDSRTITMCGMAAGFAALFGTPLAASVFSMEVISVGVMYYAALFPCVLASVIAHQVALRLGGETTAFAVSGVPDGVDAPLLVKLILFGAACAVLSAVVCIVFHRIGHLFKKYIPNQYVCIAVGGAAVVLLSLVLGTRDYNGAGVAVIERAMAGQASYAAFFLKLVLTAVTIGVGYKGGEIVPVLFIGSTFGAAYGGFFGLNPSFAAGLGMTAIFCGVTNSPLTSILLAYELFGGRSLGLFALVISIAYMLSGYFGLYSEQKILYSKMRPQFIDRKTK
ncbi:MAG: chloride channel protein [Eubacteriales bacterium]|nr:chloride channel protein [Eubacteriales bacterium]